MTVIQFEIMAGLDPDSSPATIPIEADLVLESCDDLSPEVLEQCREIFRLSIAGQSQQEIATHLGLSRPTISRRLSQYREAYRRQLESQPRIHLISERLSRYESIAEDALKDAETADDDRGKKLHRELALKSMQLYDALALAVGVIPKAADRAIIFTQDLDSISERSDVEKSPEELRADILQLLRYGRQLL